MNRVGVGLVGAGAFGEFCLSAFAGVSELQVVAICDANSARAAHYASAYGATAYDDLVLFLADPRVEIVALNTPPHLHGPQALAVLEAGKHLFCEKPLALTMADAKAIRVEAARRGLRATVDYVMRANPLWQALAVVRQQGTLGRLLHMDLANHAAGLELPSGHWFWDPAKSGGIWIEHGVHFFDAFAWVAGHEGVITDARMLEGTSGRDDRVEALARFGITAAHFYHGFTHDGASEQTTVRLTFEGGHAVLHEWVPTELIVGSVRSDVANQLVDSLPGRVEIGPDRAGQARISATLTEGKSAVYRQCIQQGIRQLAVAVRAPSRPLDVTLDDAISSLDMAIRATTLQHDRS